MVFKQSAGPYQRQNKTTFQIMIDLTICLAIVWLAAIITTFVKNPSYTQTLADGTVVTTSGYGIHSIFLMVVSLVTTFACDALVTVLRNKKDKELLKKIPHDILHSYSWITAMIFTLSLPVWTSYYVIIIGSIFATIVGKYVFGGFGKNIFNPAAMGRIFVMLSFSIATPKLLPVGPSTEAATGSTITSIINSSTNGSWLSDAAVSGYSMWDILGGNYFGAMGETFTLLILALGIFLVIRKDIDWRMPVFYLGTVILSSLVISLTLGHINPGRYLIYQLGTGGLMFGAVFMITDPVTTPTNQFGKCLVGVIAGLLTVAIRIGTDNPEGVVYSIAIVNLITPMINGLTTGKTTSNLKLKYGIVFGTLAVTLGIMSGLSIYKNGGRMKYDANGNVIKNTVKNVNNKNMTVNNYVIEVNSEEVR